MGIPYPMGWNFYDGIKVLYKQGGIPRFYRGIAPALIQGPISRFGDTAANTGVISVLNNYGNTKDIPITLKTILSSSIASLWRICIMPLDTTKTIMQVEGENGLSILKNKINKSGPKVLYNGALAASSATFVGHYPWFVTYNLLSDKLPEQSNMWLNLQRNAIIGFSSSFVSDCSSNSIRVIKTFKQSSIENISYKESVNLIIKQDKIHGLFLRGLKTRILSNGLQSILFTILFNGFKKQWNVN